MKVDLFGLFSLDRFINLWKVGHNTINTQNTNPYDFKKEPTEVRAVISKGFGCSLKSSKKSFLCGYKEKEKENSYRSKHCITTQYIE
jgi:hypothetical protein